VIVRGLAGNAGRRAPRSQHQVELGVSVSEDRDLPEVQRPFEARHVAVPATLRCTSRTFNLKCATPTNVAAGICGSTGCPTAIAETVTP
jgi:hypothetical protein